MQTKPIKHLLIWPTAFGLWLLTSTFGLPAFAQGSSLGSFTYQGRLNDANGPASGLFDFQFSLYPASFGTNNQVGTSVSSSSLPVTNGLFTAALSFPMASTSFDGNDCWLEISVRPSLSGSTFVTLSPRQQITAAPYAMRAANAMRRPF